MSASTVCRNGIGPGALLEMARMSLQCPPTPPPLTDNHRNSAEWSISPSSESGTYAKKQEIGSAFAFWPGRGAFDNTGDANMNHPLET